MVEGIRFNWENPEENDVRWEKTGQEIISYNKYGNVTGYQENGTSFYNVGGYKGKHFNAVFTYDQSTFDESTYTSFEDLEDPIYYYEEDITNQKTMWVEIVGQNNCDACYSQSEPNYKEFYVNDLDYFQPGDRVRIYKNSDYSLYWDQNCGECPQEQFQEDEVIWEGEICSVDYNPITPTQHPCYFESPFQNHDYRICFTEPVSVEGFSLLSLRGAYLRKVDKYQYTDLPDLWIEQVDYKAYPHGITPFTFKTGAVSYYLSAFLTGDNMQNNYERARTPIHDIKGVSGKEDYIFSCWLRNNGNGGTAVFKYEVYNDNTGQLYSNGSSSINNLSEEWTYSQFEIPLDFVLGTTWKLKAWIETPKTDIEGSIINVDDILIYPLGSRYEYYSFDKFGNSTYATDANDNTTHIESDHWGRLIALYNADGDLLQSKEYYIKDKGTPLTERNNHTTTTNYLDEELYSVKRTYFDGLARPVQAIVHNWDENYCLYQNTTEYDLMGNPNKFFKPFYVSGTNIGETYRTDYEDQVNLQYGSNYAFTEKTYYNEPQSRVQNEKSPRENNEPQIIATYDEYVNESDFSHIDGISYPAGQLIIRETKDPRSNITREIFDKSGNRIAQINPIGYNHEQDDEGQIIFDETSEYKYAYTYFVYNDAGRLIKVQDPDLKNSVYSYNSRGQLLQSETPDDQTTKYRYNTYGQLRFVMSMEDSDPTGVLEKFSYNKYDIYGRIKESGKLNIPIGGTSVFSNWEYINQSSFPDNNTQGYDPRIQYEYDLSKATNSIGRVSKEISFVNYAQQRSDDVTYEYDNNGQVSKKQFYYDQLISENLYMQYFYNRQGQPVSVHFRNDDTPQQNFDIEYDYDKFGRIINAYSGYPSQTSKDVLYNYDYYGKLTTKCLRPSVGGPCVLPMNFSYNIRNMIVNMDNPKFSYNLEYDLNSNIITQRWHNPYFDLPNEIPHVNQYDYFYDDMNRLIGGNYNYFESGSENLFDVKETSINPNRGSYRQKYDVAYWYTDNGNFDYLKRYNNLSELYSQEYAYTPGTNKIYGVMFVDDGHTNPVFYTHDANGNLTTDPRSNIQSIDYDYFRNMPSSMQRGQVVSKFRYDANGQRIVRTVDFEENYYLDFVVMNNGDVLRYTTPGGYATVDELGNLQKHYEIKDWLGTIRAIYDDNINLVSLRDHYPFGKIMPGREYESDLEGRRYQFTGHENDWLTGYDYHGARYYNRDLARYISVDPLAEESPSWTPFRYGYNNPIRFFDPMGLLESTHIDEEGNVIAEYDDGDDGVYVHSNGTTQEQVDQQRDDNENTGGDGNHIGEIGGVIKANKIYTNTLEKNTSEAEGIYNPFTFKNNVKTNGKWDLKNNKKTIYGLANDGETKFSFKGELMESQDIGNHHFGAVGKAYGLFSETFLLKQAGAYQIESGTSKPEWQKYQTIEVPGNIKMGIPPSTRKVILPPYGDDPRDQRWIKAGFQY